MSAEGQKRNPLFDAYRKSLDYINKLYQGKPSAISKRIGLDPLLSSIFSRFYRYPYIYQTEYRGENVRFDIHSSRERPASFKDELLDKIIDNLAPGDTYYDIGAGTGTISCVIGSHLDDGAVYAFEPLPANYEAIQRNFAQNPFEGVAFQCALSNVNGETEFAVPSGVGAGYTNASLSTAQQSISHFWRDKTETITVQTTRGDDIIEREDIPTPNIISIDVEGAETDVIQGLENTLSDEECRLVLIEVHKYLLGDFGTSAEELEHELRSLGFTIERFDVREFEIDGEQGELYRIAAQR